MSAYIKSYPLFSFPGNDNYDPIPLIEKQLPNFREIVPEMAHRFIDLQDEYSFVRPYERPSFSSVNISGNLNLKGSEGAACLVSYDPYKDRFEYSPLGGPSSHNKFRQYASDLEFFYRIELSLITPPFSSFVLSDKSPPPTFYMNDELRAFDKDLRRFVGLISSEFSLSLFDDTLQSRVRAFGSSGGFVSKCRYLLDRTFQAPGVDRPVRDSQGFYIQMDPSRTLEEDLKEYIKIYPSVLNQDRLNTLHFMNYSIKLR